MVSGSVSGPADPNLKVGENERVELLQDRDCRFLCNAVGCLWVFGPTLDLGRYSFGHFSGGMPAQIDASV